MTSVSTGSSTVTAMDETCGRNVADVSKLKSVAKLDQVMQVTDYAFTIKYFHCTGPTEECWQKGCKTSKNIIALAKAKTYHM